MFSLRKKRKPNEEQSTELTKETGEKLIEEFKKLIRRREEENE